jgi:hypothetical protein
MKRLLIVLISALLGIAVVGGGSSSSASAATSSKSQPCAPSRGLTFICGVAQPEDLVLVPHSNWLLASGIGQGSGLHLVDTRRKTVRNLFAPGAANIKADKTKYPDCPSPLDPAKAELVGLSLRQTNSGRYTVYAINWGGRQSVEVFTLDTRGSAPTATWVGCVLMPAGLQGDGVASFDDGTILATVPNMPGTTFDDVLAGKITGAVYMWKPGTTAFQKIPGTELSGNNGIETSPDGSKYYVVSVGQKRIVEFGRQNPGTPLRFAQLKGMWPDNVHWTANNQLMTAGQIPGKPSCKGTLPECARGYLVDTIDPTTMAVTKLASGPRTPDFPGPSTAVQVGCDLWLGSFLANRIAYRLLEEK